MNCNQVHVTDYNCVVREANPSNGLRCPNCDYYTRETQLTIGGTFICSCCGAVMTNLTYGKVHWYLPPTIASLKKEAEEKAKRAAASKGQGNTLDIMDWNNRKLVCTRVTPDHDIIVSNQSGYYCKVLEVKIDATTLKGCHIYFETQKMNGNCFFQFNNEWWYCPVALAKWGFRIVPFDHKAHVAGLIKEIGDWERTAEEAEEVIETARGNILGLKIDLQNSVHC